MKVMDEHPDNAVDVIEDVSREVKRGLFEDKQSTLRDLPQTTAAELLAEQQRLLFSRPEEADQEEELVLHAPHCTFVLVILRGYMCHIQG